MYERLWNELAQSKHHHIYCILLLGYRKRLLSAFNIIILAFSSAGIMGWSFWKNLPFISCIIVAMISLLKLLSPHIVPSEKQLEKLDDIIDFYCDYFNKMEQLWFSYYNNRITEEELQIDFYKLKDTERSINKTVNELIKRTNKSILTKTDEQTTDYLIRNFKL